MLERRKRGRPLGSGVKNYCALGCRFTEREYSLIQENLKKLKEEYGSNNKIILNLFKRKAILEEMEKKEYTEEEKRYLEEMKLNMEIEFYLNSIAQKTVQIYDYELLEVYKNNTEALKDKNTVEVYPQLQQALFNQKLGEEKVKVINELVEKYKINDVLKEYVKIEEPIEKTEIEE